MERVKKRLAPSDMMHTKWMSIYCIRLYCLMGKTGLFLCYSHVFFVIVIEDQFLCIMKRVKDHSTTWRYDQYDVKRLVNEIKYVPDLYDRKIKILKFFSIDI